MLILVAFAPVNAQDVDAIERVAMQITTEYVVAFYNVRDDGSLELLARTSNFTILFLPRSFSWGEWEIFDLSDEGFAISPDRQHFAFTAYSRQQSQAALFIYTIGDTELSRKALPGYGVLEWSPNSQMLLLTPPVNVLSSDIGLQEAYVYELNSDEITQLTFHTNRWLYSPGWLDDSKYFFYVGSGASCSSKNNCIYSSNIYVANASITQGRSLTNLSQEIPMNLHLLSGTSGCYPHNAIWSPNEERIYYVVGCLKEDFERSSLYSVSLQGDNRLEVELGAIFPEDFFDTIRGVYSNSSTGDIYLVVDSVVGMRTPYGDPLFKSRWLILRYRTPRLIDILAAGIGGIDITSISSNSEKLAVIVRDWKEIQMAIIDLVTGRISYHDIAANQVCGLEWIDLRSLAYLDSEACYSPEIQQNLWRYDVNTGITDKLTPALDGIVFMLPRQFR